MELLNQQSYAILDLADAAPDNWVLVTQANT